MYGYGYQYSSILKSGGAAVGFTGLLDTYPGAAAAYSLRQLISSYSGDAIRVRRSSDNAELNIGFVANELDTSALTTFASGTNAFVTTWYDQSGNANDAVQTTAAKQPQIVIVGVIISEGSKPSLRFDSDGFTFTNPLTYSNGFSFATLNPELTSQWSIFTNGAQTTPLFQSGSTASISLGYLLNNIWVNNSLIVGNRNNLYVATTNQRNIISMQINTSVYNIPSFFDRLSFNFNGLSQEIVIYETDQSANRAGIETNTNDYYGIY